MHGVDGVIVNLHQLIDKKIEYFGDIKGLTLLQKEDIAKNEGNNIEALVQRKQNVIDRVDEIDKAFSQQFELLKQQLNIVKLDEVDVKKYPELGELKGKVQKILVLAREIMILEQDNKEKIDVIFNNLKSELRKINIGKKSIRAYETPIVNKDGIYFDKKTE